MAYQQNRGSNNQRSSFSTGSKPVASTGSGSEVIFSTDLFAPDSDKSKALGTIKTKEAVTIPAGSYINLYEVTDRKGEKSPNFRLQVRPGKSVVSK